MKAAAALLLAGALSLRAAPPPNLVVILSDDMGWSDLGCYGGEIRTPVLDGLAQNGLRFTQFYNTGRCCPTRASLLTGLHPHQAGVGHMTAPHGDLAAYAGNLNDRGLTLAEALKPAGYRAYMAGKWHVTRHDGPEAPTHTWPLQRGFDAFYGTIRGGGSFYDPTALCRGNTFITPENDPLYRPATYYYTDAISDNAVAFLRDHARGHADKPFLLYVAYTAAHWPLHALPEDIARQRGRYDAGYAAVRAARLERQKALGLLGPDTALTPGAAAWDDVADKAWEARGMEVYAAMVESMDRGIGRVVDELRASGRLDNTLLLYLQDNGGCAEDMGRKSNAAQVADARPAPMKPDQLQPAIWPPMQTRDGRPVRTGPGVMPGPADTYVAYGRGWANVSNTPFREYKHGVHEGGIRTPLIAHWPAGIPAARRGALAPEPGQLVDIMATCLDLSGAAYPPERNGTPLLPPEGVSLRPVLEGKPLVRPKPLVWEHEGNRAIRDGDWKLVAKGPRGPWELYDLAADPTEMNDLAAREPGRVRDLAAQWQAWATRAGVLPWPWDKNARAK